MVYSDGTQPRLPLPPSKRAERYIRKTIFSRLWYGLA